MPQKPSGSVYKVKGGWGAMLCRCGLHKKRLRSGYWADRTFLMVGVNLYECQRCDWHMLGIGEPS